MSNFTGKGTGYFFIRVLSTEDGVNSKLKIQNSKFF